MMMSSFVNRMILGARRMPLHWRILLGGQALFMGGAAFAKLSIVTPPLPQSSNGGANADSVGAGGVRPNRNGAAFATAPSVVNGATTKR